MENALKLSSASRSSHATRNTFILAIAALAISCCADASATDAATRCQAISRMKIDGVTITSAFPVDSGTFTPPGATSAIVNLPPFCRVAATLRPTPDSNIKIELWMPEKDWNGRFLGTGNGGGAGKISYRSLALGMRRGFATANTDMGTSPEANAVVGHPERWADFGYRSTHQMTVVSKQILQAYYNKPQSHAYFVGCSTGGGQGLMEAQRFPSDYNGIIAGAPANNRTLCRKRRRRSGRQFFDRSSRMQV
jgi:feruloyl esterase